MFPSEIYNRCVVNDLMDSAVFFKKFRTTKKIVYLPWAPEPTSDTAFGFKFEIDKIEKSSQHHSGGYMMIINLLHQILLFG